MEKKSKATYSSLKGFHRAVPIIMIFAAVFMIFCYILPDMGAVGNAASGVLLGLFSWGAYIIPSLLVIHAIFYAQDLDEKRILSRIIFSLVTMIAISSLSYAIATWNETLVFSIADFYNLGREARGGGVIGGVIGFCLIKCISRVGLVIFTCAVFAIYISYFFAKGKKGITAVFMNILKFIVIICALIEKLIKTVFGKMRKAKENKAQRSADMKESELTDDEFFAVDNGMDKLKISELGIEETRTKADSEAIHTFQDKVKHKSSVSAEEAAEAERRERAEKFFYTDIFEDDDLETESSNVRKSINIDYGDTDDAGPSKNDIIIEDGSQFSSSEATAAPIHDDCADSVFTKDFDPFGMLADEELASKPSSKSLIDDIGRPRTVTEDISELTEEEVERAKRIRDFEARKAAIIGSRRAVPVENDGEFTGVQKNVDFREYRSEHKEADESENLNFTMKIDKNAEAPKAEPANYTSIGFGESEDNISTTITKDAFTYPETIYSHKEPEEQAQPLYTRQIYTEDRPAPSYSEPSVPYNAQQTSPYSAHTPAAEPIAHSYSQPAYVYEPAVQSYNEPTVTSNAQYTPAYTEPATAYEPVAPTYSQPAAADEPIVQSYNKEEPESETVAPTYVKPTPRYEDIEEETDFTPSFKSYNDPSADDDELKNDSETDCEEDEDAKTLTVERTMIGDEESETEYSESYDSFAESPEDELYENYGEPDDEDPEYSEISPEDDAGYDDDEIPPEEQNPVVMGYRDMFSALRSEPEEEYSEDESEAASEYTPTENDYKLISPDERDEEQDHISDYQGEYEEIDDTPPFDEPTVKAHEVKKEEPKPEKKKPDFSNFKIPPLELLGLEEASEDDTSEINENTKTLIDTLASFNVTASIKGVDRGPRITRYEVVPARGVKVNAITNLFNDIALNLAREGIRMEAPIPGKSAIGFEIPNRHPKNVRLRELLECEEFQNAKSKTFVGIGKNVAGLPVFADIEKFPHALVAGATGMGKSVCINSIMISMLYKARPDEVRFIMIDPKKVEFKIYSGIPHLLIPVITDAKQAAGALMWAVEEMERRFELIEQQNVRNLTAYNEKVAANPGIGEKLPRIVIVIDELNDLMMQVRDPVEDLIMRLAQKARAAGMHIIIGTQRPDVKVVTGTIKANINTRLSCKVSSIVDSRTILDMAGAEKLLDKGDMLFKPVDKTKPIRVQGAFVSDNEVESIMKFLKDQVGEAVYDEEIFAEINKAAQKCGNKKSGGAAAFGEDIEDDGQECGYYNDQQFLDAVHLAITSKKISTSLLQRKLSIGYGKAAKYIDAMEEIGVVSEPKGQKPRDVLITMDEWHEKLSRVELN